jgi:diadenosine tetraphosphate (Ap4A) HIT family hydrolase
MVNMRVRHENEIQFPRPVRLYVAIARLNRLVALVHAAIHAKTPAAGFNNMAGTGHGFGRAQKLHFHGHSLRGKYAPFFFPAQGRPFWHRLC